MKFERLTDYFFLNLRLLFLKMNELNSRWSSFRFQIIRLIKRICRFHILYWNWQIYKYKKIISSICYIIHYTVHTSLASLMTSCYSLLDPYCPLFSFLPSFWLAHVERIIHTILLSQFLSFPFNFFLIHSSFP